MIFLLGGKNTEGERNQADVVESLDLPRHPHEQLAHPAAPRLGAVAHCLLESRFYGNEDPLVVSCERAWGGV